MDDLGHGADRTGRRRPHETIRTRNRNLHPRPLAPPRSPSAPPRPHPDMETYRGQEAPPDPDMSPCRGRGDVLGAKRVSGADSGVSRLLSVTDPTEASSEEHKA